MTELQKEKNQLFKELEMQGISKRTINIMKKIPREIFVPKEYQYATYKNIALSIGNNQTISQPYIVGYMVDELNLNNSDIVLEIGCGSGYNLAILSLLSKYVFSIERISNLVEKAKKNIKSLGIRNCKIILGDGTLGYNQKYNFFDKIIITARAYQFPITLFRQLKIGGIMILPMGRKNMRVYLYKIFKTSDKTYRLKKLIPVSFVPLVKAST